MKSTQPLTDKQQRVLNFITEYKVENGSSPTLKEVSAFLGTPNISTAQYFVDQIRERGHLEKTAHAPRGIVVQMGQTVPLLGRIAAGTPIEAIEERETVSIPGDIKLSPNAAYYALQVVGDSMIDMGILDGDVVFVQHQFTANEGDVVVAIVDGGATLKVFRRRGDKIVLEARNPSFAPIVLDTVEIRGVFIGLMRAK